MNFRTWFETVDTLELIDLIYTPDVKSAVKRVLPESSNADQFVEKINETPEVQEAKLQFNVGEPTDHGFLSNAGADPSEVRRVADRLFLVFKSFPKNFEELIKNTDKLINKFHARLIVLSVNPNWYRKDFKTVNNDIESTLSHEITHIHVVTQEILKDYKRQRSIFDVAKINTDTEYFTWQDEPAANANNLAYDIVNQNYDNPLGQKSISVYWRLPDNHNVKRKVFRDAFKTATKYISPQEYNERLKKYIKIALEKRPYEGEEDRMILSRIDKLLYDPYTNASLSEKIKSFDRYKQSHPHLAGEIDKLVKGYLSKRTEKQRSFSQIMRDAIRKLGYIDKHPNIPQNKKVEMINKVLEPYSDDNKDVIIKKSNLSPELLKNFRTIDDRPSAEKINDFLNDLDKLKQGVA